MLTKALTIVDNISDWLGKGVSYAVLLMIGVVVCSVAARYFFRSPLEWSWEVTRQLFGAHALLGGAYALHYGVHVNVDIIHGHLSPRMRAALDVVTSVVFFFVTGLLLWQGGVMAWRSWAILQHSSESTFHAPLYFFKSIIPLAAFSMLLQGGAKLIRDIHIAITGKTL